MNKWRVEFYEEPEDAAPSFIKTVEAESQEDAETLITSDGGNWKRVDVTLIKETS